METWGCLKKLIRKKKEKEKKENAGLWVSGKVVKKR